jgi:hypothetical protein
VNFSFHHTSVYISLLVCAWPLMPFRLHCPFNSLEPCDWVLTILLLLKNPDHASFVKEIAAADPPEHLNSLLNVLQARGSTQNITLPSPPFLYGSFPAVDPLRVHMYDLRLLKLYLSGEKIVSPGAKRGLIPVVVPLSESPAGSDVLWIE